MAEQTATKKKEKAAVGMELPKYHFLMRIVGQQAIEGQVLDGPELDTTLNSWLTEYKIHTIHNFGPHRDQSNTVMGHVLAYHLVRKEQ